MRNIPLAGAIAALLTLGVNTATATATAPATVQAAVPVAMVAVVATPTAAVSPRTLRPVHKSRGVSGHDRTFLAHNVQTDLAEITAGKLAQKRTTDPTVRRTATQIISDHTTVLARARALGRADAMDLPDTPNAMQRKIATKLKKLTGAAFTRYYLATEVAGHKSSIAQTNTEISKGTGAGVTFARQYRPSAQNHLKMLSAERRNS